VGVYALLLAVITDTVAITYTVFAAVALGIAAVVRRGEWAAGAAVLLLIAGADAGRGWLGLALLVVGLASTAAGLRLTAAWRWALLAVGAAALVGAGLDLAVWQGWALGTVVQVTAPVGAAAALVAALGLRLRRGPVELAGVWVAAGALVSLGSMVAGLDEVERRSGGLVFAGSTLVLAVTAAVLVPVLGAAMRWVAAAIAAAAWLPAWWALRPSEEVATLVGTGVALAVLAGALAANGLRPGQPWILPGGLFAVATQVLAWTVAVAVLPDAGLVVVVVLAASAELIALGVIGARPELLVASPAAACAAWLIAVGDTVAGRPNWVTVPIGLTVLVMVGLVRWIRRGRGTEVTGYDVIGLELVGMTVVVGSPIAQILAGDLWNAVPAFVLGVLLAGWGAVTRVVWRAAFGAATVVLTAVLVIGVPLSTVVTWRGPALWIALSLLGVVAIVAASTLERSRDAVEQVGRRLDVMTEGWERIPRRHDAGGGSSPSSADDVPSRDSQPVP
jgi:hypothetical protein